MAATFTEGVRKKLLNLVKSKFDDKGYFKSIEASPPRSAMPSALDMPSLFITRGVESLEQLTNLEKTSLFALELIGFCKADRDLELVKADLEDFMEKVMHELQEDATFLTLAVRVRVIQADGGPLALATLGLVEGTFPPFGSIRMSVLIDFDYYAIC